MSGDRDTLVKLSINIMSAGYSTSEVLLRDVNLELTNEVALVSGPSGSGKTTLVLAITGVLKHILGGFVEGSIDVNGVNTLSEEGFREARGKIAVLLQDPERQIIFPTPLDETMATLEALGYTYEEAERRARELLAGIGLAGKENRHIEELSTGERRRLTLAILEAYDPWVYLLDEPSANLDPEGILHVRKLVKEWSQRGKIVLVVEHKIHYFRDLADKTYTLRSGRLEPVLIESELYVNPPECREEHISSGELLIRLEGDIGYNTDKPVIRDVNFEVYRGEIIALVGPNGSGKTTLLKTLVGRIKPLRGTLESRAEKVFYAPQNPDLVFVSWSLKRELDLLVKHAGIHIEELTSKYPWISRSLDKSPFLLSHGQRRLVEVLIALSHGRDLALLDEPTTGLDPTVYSSIVKEIKKHREKGSVVVATHDPRLVLEADRVYIARDGRLVEADKCKVVEDMVKTTGALYA